MPRLFRSGCKDKTKGGIDARHKLYFFIRSDKPGLAGRDGRYLRTMAIASKIRIQRLALALGLVLMAIKFAAWWWTNSNAILTDALESIINVVAGGFALYSLVLASLPKDENHPYGHGKIEFVSAGFEGGMIFLAGCAIIIKASYNLVVPQPLAELGVGAALTAGTGAVNYLMGWALSRRGRREHSLTLQASGRHLITDAWSSLGLVVGLGLVMLTGLQWIDNLLALGFGAFILFTGFRLLRRAFAGIMDEADYQLLENLAHFLQEHRRPNWIDVHNLRVITYGADLHVDCHLTVPWYLDTRGSHAEVKDFEALVDGHTERGVEFFIHVDPCEPPENCRICTKRDCPVRQRPQEVDTLWRLDTLMGPAPHHVRDHSGLR